MKVIIFLLLTVFLGIIIVFVAKFPLNINPYLIREPFYYRGILGIFYRQPRSCSFLGCWGPDLMPFLRDQLLIGVDSGSFSYLGNYQAKGSGYFDWGGTDSDIYRDKTHLIISNEIIKDGDPNTIKIFDGYATDKNNVYLAGSIIRNLDTASFQNLKCGFFRDKNNIYNYLFSFNKPLDMVDKNTFQIVASKEEDCIKLPYSAFDKNHFYKWNSYSGFEIQNKI